MSMKSCTFLARSGLRHVFNAAPTVSTHTFQRTLHSTPPLYLLPRLPPLPVIPAKRTIKEETAKRPVILSLLPLWRGQTKQGVRYAPAILHSKIKEFLTPEPRAWFLPDSLLNSVSNPSYPEDMAAFSEAISVEMGKIEMTNEMIVNLGGDHSISMITVPVMLAKHPNLRVIWIDAHADINSPDTSPSGNFHGMPVYYFTDSYGDHTNREVGANSNKVKYANLVYVGVRDIDAGERKCLKDNKIRNYEKSEIDNRGITAVVKEIIETLDLENNPVHISFDVDSLDPVLAPSTGTKVPGGLTTEDVVEIIKEVKKTGNLVSCDVVEFNPLIGSDRDVDLTIQSITPVIRSILE